MRNKEAEILWNLYDEIEDIGIRFLAENMGLQPTAYHHYIFLDFWIESVVPEFKYNRDDDPYLQEYLAEYEAKKKQTYFWHFSKPIEWQGKQEIVDSVHWCRGKLNIGEVIEKLQKTKWPSSRQIRTKRLGGRPVELDRIGVEAIVCYILKHKQKLSHKEIAVILGYRLQRDGSGNLMSRTVSDRIKRGEMQLHKRDPSNRITDK